MNIIVTGRTGIGKTTVCEKVVNVARGMGYTCGGMLAHRSQDGNVVLQDIRTGATRLVPATCAIYRDGVRVGSYCFNPATVDFCVRAIEGGVTSDILVADEVGPLGLGDGNFARAMTLAERVCGNTILVVRREFLRTVRSWMGGESLVFEARLDNRDRLPQEIASAVLGQYAVAGVTAEVL